MLYCMVGRVIRMYELVFLFCVIASVAYTACVQSSLGSNAANRTQLGESLGER